MSSDGNGFAQQIQSLGIRTEAAAQRIARDWMIKYGPVEMINAGDNCVNAAVTMRLVRRPRRQTQETK